MMRTSICVNGVSFSPCSEPDNIVDCARSLYRLVCALWRNRLIRRAVNKQVKLALLNVMDH